MSTETTKWQCPECKGHWNAETPECPFCKVIYGQHIAPGTTTETEQQK